jgi:hypothetical protein
LKIALENLLTPFLVSWKNWERQFLLDMREFSSLISAILVGLPSSAAGIVISVDAQPSSHGLLRRGLQQA